jgi:hypothetical protein
MSLGEKVILRNGTLSQDPQLASAAGIVLLHWVIGSLTKIITLSLGEEPGQIVPGEKTSAASYGDRKLLQINEWKVTFYSLFCLVH